MTISDINVLLPLIIIAATALAIMMIIAFYRCHALTALLTFGGITLSFVSLVMSYPILPRQVTPLLILDNYYALYSGLILASSFFVTLLSYGYLEKQAGNREELYVLLLLATLGSMLLIASNHFASLFLGLEILSVSLYSLIAYQRDRNRGFEASIKYLVLAATSASVLLFGMALIYAELGTMYLPEIARIANVKIPNVFVLAGTAMILVGLGFKLALAPFHMWTADVYEGAPAPVTAFIASASKGAVFALLLRYFTLLDVHAYVPLFVMFTIIAIASMFIGNLLALLQNTVKRMLAYSSIAHLGYLLVAFLAGRAYAARAVTFYLVTYFVTIIGAFGVVSVLSDKNGEPVKIEDYSGMAYRRPLLCGVFTAMLLSLAGIPLTAGFIGKFYIITAGASSALWLLVVVLIINSAIGLYYYMRLIVAMFRPAEGELFAASSKISLSSGITLTVLFALLVWIGVYPAFLVDAIQVFLGGLI